MIRKTPRIHHNKLQKESGIPKKTFEKHLRSLIMQGKIRHYEFDGKKHYLIKTGKHGKIGLSRPLSPDAKLEWKIAWDLQDSQELFDSMKKSFGIPSLEESDIKWARFVFEKILCKMLSVIIHDALSDPKKNQHRRFIIKYKKLIKEFFEIIVNTESANHKPLDLIPKKNDLTPKKNDLTPKKNLNLDIQQFKIKGSEAELEPFAEEISRLYSETDHSVVDDKRLEEIFTSNIEFQLSSLILDNNKIKRLEK